MCVYVCMYVFIRVYIRVCVYVCVRTYVHAYVEMYVCMHACMHICIAYSLFILLSMPTQRVFFLQTGLHKDRFSILSALHNSVYQIL